MIKATAQFVPVKVNGWQEGKDLAKKYGVEGYPTILFIEPGGKEVSRITGYADAPVLTKKLEGLAEAVRETPNLEKLLKDKPNDGEAHAKLAWYLAVQQKIEDAVKHVELAEKSKTGGDTLGNACNEIGDAYQNNNKFPDAIRFFTKADKTAQDVKIRSYAKISIAQCFGADGKLAEAKKAAQEVVDLKGAPAGDVEMAKRFIAIP